MSSSKTYLEAHEENKIIITFSFFVICFPTYKEKVQKFTPELRIYFSIITGSLPKR